MIRDTIGIYGTTHLSLVISAAFLKKNYKVFLFEKDKGQIFKVNVSYVPKSNIKLINDKIENTIDYIDIIKFIKKEFNFKRFNLLESVANHLVDKILNRYNLKYVKLSVQKVIDEELIIKIEITNE